MTRALVRPGRTVAWIAGGIALVLAGIFPFVGTAYFPRTDSGQFVINVKAPSGSRLEVTNQYIARVENDVRQVIGPDDLGMIVSNIAITPDLSAMYTSNSSMDTAFVQVSLKEDHKCGSYEYMRRVSGVLIPQNLLYPRLQLNIDREHASLIGLTPKQVVDNVITALTSNGMIEPSYWIDPKTGNNYMLTMQYFDKQIQNMSMEDFEQIPLRAVKVKNYTTLQSVADIARINTQQKLTIINFSASSTSM